MRKKRFRFFWEEPFINDIESLEKGLFENFRRMLEERMGPRAELQDLDDKFIFRIALPGFDKEEIDLEVSESNLKLHAEKKKISEKKGEHVYTFGKQETFVSRAYSLPEKVIPEKTKAKFENGVLMVVLPKVAKKKSKKIKIQ